ncbi:flagellar biosynthesis anti-sigma factor FlgM [Aliiglaciecola sp. CAU 1673]|uniref:flagellar biosynthesis anti-sigma factor FlgM n=1 Tax=Aliiglaciecola sp. CAU 1673 TaxID=3032595 RepID=UPI0023D9DFB6|nr:flagellar biosynthesis anti-sigma factor FlgM [Aliiglaciecola sp. CAU 1673]MDF2178332.1 flagellar biosynthesis anti-sigma factor FlgM [Aliiglaciecola sp. CAU 1673]
MSVNNINGNMSKAQIESQKLQQQQQTQNQAAQSGAAKAQTAALAPRQDSVSLTQSAQQLSQVQKKGNDAPVDQAKVDRLKKAIQSGEYRINPEVLAQKIAKLEAELFGVKS